jgi:hypothetical protein
VHLIIVVNESSLFAMTDPDDQRAWRRYVVDLCWRADVVPAPPQSDIPQQEEGRNTPEYCLAPDTSSLDGSPPPSPSHEVDQFDFDMYEWLERRQERDTRRQQCWAREQAQGLPLTIYYDWDVINGEAMRIAQIPPNSDPDNDVAAWGASQLTTEQRGKKNIYMGKKGENAM